MRGRGRNRELALDRIAALRKRAAECRELLHLLHGESQPAFQVGIERILDRKIDRDMQERAGRRDFDPLGAALCDHGLQPVEQSRQIRAPDIAAVNDAERQNKVLRRLREHGVELSGSPHQVEMQARDRQRERRFEIVAEPAEIGRQHDLQRRDLAREGRIGPGQRLAPGVIQIERETGLVELDPCRAGGRKLSQDLHVDRREPVDQRDRIEFRVLALTELEIGHGAEQDGSRLAAKRGGFAELVQRLV